jgi:HD-GYP domain-containing protein (c-di-GMP phosphodiesterase class II)
MTTDRPYRRAMPKEAAIAELRDGIGTQFDPVICATFIKLLLESPLFGADQVVEIGKLREQRETAAGV